MDRVLRSYAHTAWTPADPLAGLDPELRRAILTMRSTFRERWKLAPWTDRFQRRVAIGDILAERRLLCELTQDSVSKSQAASLPAAAGAPVAPPKPVSPYYQYRLAAHEQTIAAMRDQRLLQDIRDRDTIPEARADHDRREARRRALQAVNIARAKLDVQELEILADRDPSPAAVSLPAARTKPKKARKGDKDR